MPTDPNITWIPNVVVPYGTPLDSAQLNATADQPGTFVYTPGIGTLLALGDADITLVFTPNDAVNYNPVTVVITFQCVQTPATLVWSAPGAMYQGTPLSSTQLAAAANTPGVFTYTPPAGTVLPLGVSALRCVFSPTDPGYLLVSATVNVTVVKTLLSLVISPSIGFLELGSPQVFSVTALYSDGSVTDVTSSVTWSCLTGSFSTIVYTPAILGVDTIRATVNGYTATLKVDIVPIGSLTVDKTNISYKTQDMLNYFDETDRRVRTNRVSTDAQLLNLGGQLLEDLELRVTREQSRDLRHVPTGIDNRGLYFVVPVPNTITINPNNPYFSSVTGSIGSQIKTYKPYADRLVIPTSVEVDVDRTAFSITNPILCTVNGPQSLFSTSVTMPAPNTLNFWAEGLFKGASQVQVSIEGIAYPQSPWIQDRVTITEALTISKNGFTETIHRWSSISNITFRNVPAGALIEAYAFLFTAPGTPDIQRPYTAWNSRDTFYDRYWNANTNFLVENYCGDFSALEPINSYTTSSPLRDVTVEPYAYGILAISELELFYADRREPMPDNLSASNLSADPCFALDVQYDLTSVGPVRSVWLRGIPGATANSIFQYRYYAQLPDGTAICLNQQGARLPFSDTNGWYSGAPQPLKVPLLETGTYTFTLECIDTSVNTTSDSRPWTSASFTPLTSLSLSAITTNPVGICYDSWGDIWIWNGTQAIPVVLKYTGYILDAANANLYLTQAPDPDTFISINGTVISYGATPVNSTTYVDIVGLSIGETRLPEESSSKYVRRLEAIAQSDRDHSYEGTLAQINATLGFEPSPYIKIVSTDASSLININLAGLVLTNMSESLTIPLVSTAVDTMWEWNTLSAIVAAINTSATFQATLLTADGPALQLARQKNTFLISSEAITSKIQVLANPGYIIGSGQLSDPALSFTVEDGTMTLSGSPSVGLTFAYEYSVMPFELVGSPISCLGLTDPGFATVAVQSSGALAYQVREFIQAIMTADRSYWAQ